MSVRFISGFAKAVGYDGVIVRNVEDSNDGNLSPTTDYVTFSPTQVKSATDNTGAFSAADPDIRHSVRISRDEYAKLASRVSENDARAYKAGIEPLPHGVAHTYDWGYAYDRFADGTFAVTARWNLNARNGIIYWQRRKDFEDAIVETARAARGNNEDLRARLRDDHDRLFGSGDGAAAVDDAGLARRGLRQDGRLPEGGGDLPGARDDSGTVAGTNRHGNRVERHSVKVTRSYSLSALAVGYLAQREMSGKPASVEDADGHRTK